MGKGKREEKRKCGKAMGEKRDGCRMEGCQVRRWERDWGKESLKCPRLKKAQWLSHTVFMPYLLHGSLKFGD